MMTEFIDQNLSENISLEDLARLAGLSSYHFSRKFKADLGIAPHAYVLSRRIDRAKSLLNNSRLPLKLVAPIKATLAACFASCWVSLQRISVTAPDGFRRCPLVGAPKAKFYSNAWQAGPIPVRSASLAVPTLFNIRETAYSNSI
jgi:AraC-like DNA-binding protein